MTLEQVSATMLALLAEENYNQHRIGQLYNYVVKNKLAEAQKYKNAQEYFAQHVKALSRATLAAYGAVAKAFSAAHCTQYGVSALSLLLTYEEAADITRHADDPGLTPIEVPGENGAVQSKLFGNCTVEDMRKALQRKRKPSSSKPLPEADMAHFQHYRTVVTSKFPKDTPVRVSVRNLKGKALVSFMYVPMDEVGTLTEALLDGVPPLRSVG
jgi:hypothetical protein